MLWLLRLLLLLPALWAAGALRFDAGSAPLAAAFLVVAALLLTVVRPFRRGLLLFLLAFGGVLAWWLSIEPRGDRDWQADVAELPRAEIDGERVTLHNVRDVAWRSDTDYDVRWETRSYDLSQIIGLDLFMSYWGSDLIAHTIMSWEFADGRHLAISIETRKEVGEEYSAVRGFFRQYELDYVVADERDLIRVRSNVRGEQVYLYRLRTPPDRARLLLLDYLRRINELAEHPAFYNALTHNCTTTIFLHVRHLLGRIPFDVRMLANGKLDEMLWEQGVINRELPFAELKQRSRVPSIATGPDYSLLIREGLPERPPAVDLPPLAR